MPYFIHGIEKGSNAERLLIQEHNNKPITNRILARQLAKVLSYGYGVKGVRIERVESEEDPKPIVEITK